MQQPAATDLPSADATARMQALEARRKTAIRSAFTRLHPLALGCGVGVTCGLGVLGATLLLVLQGGKRVGVNLQALANFFPGYRVDTTGAFVGAIYGFAAGFMLGYAIAAFRNLALRLVMGWARWSAERWRQRHLLDEV
jgi:hypothetical protein